MTITAERCVPVTSRWVHAFILTCDGKLAVWYRRRVRGRRVPGVCCYYPATNRNYFNLAITWAGPGRFVRRFLYKRLAYRIIKPPCPAVGCAVQTACCAGALPTALHLSLALDGSTVVLTWDGSAYWAGSAAVSCGDAVRWRLACTGGDVGGLQLEFSCNGGAWQPTTQSVGGACDPLAVTYQIGFSPVFGCTACGGRDFNATLTT